MARPRKSPADRRTEQVGLALTPAERLDLTDRAREAGMTLTAYIRTQAITGRVTVRQTQALDFATYDQLRRIGVLLNQIARVANTTAQLPPDLPELIGAVERVLMESVLDGSQGHS